MYNLNDTNIIRSCVISIQTPVDQKKNSKNLSVRHTFCTINIKVSNTRTFLPIVLLSDEVMWYYHYDKMVKDYVW